MAVEERLEASEFSTDSDSTFSIALNEQNLYKMNGTCRKFCFIKDYILY